MAHFVPSKPKPKEFDSLNIKTIRQIMQKENTGSTLYVLEAHNRNIKGIDDFGQYTKLRSVDLSFNQLQALKGFEKLVDLRELKVYANRLASLDGLERNGHLEKLLVHGNCLTDLPTAIAKLRSLKMLRLDRNRFTSALSLARFSTLTYLDLSDNRLTSLKGLQNLVSLEELLVNRNELTESGDLQALSDCKRLESLHLSDNHLTSLVGLKGLVSLEVLHVRRNHLTSLDSLPSLAALSELYVNGNRLTTLQKLADSAPSLDVLDARENRLDDLDPLLNSLNRFEELREASLGDNPCTATKPSTSNVHPSWWYVTVRQLKALERLDDVTILSAHRDTPLQSELPPGMGSPTDNTHIHADFASPAPMPASQLSKRPFSSLPVRPSTAPSSRCTLSSTISKPFGCHHQPTTEAGVLATPRGQRPVFHAPSARSGFVSPRVELVTASKAESLEQSAIHLREEFHSLRESLRETTEKNKEEEPNNLCSGTASDERTNQHLRKKLLGRALRYSKIVDTDSSARPPGVVPLPASTSNSVFEEESEGSSPRTVLNQLEEQYENMCKEMEEQEEDGGRPETDDQDGCFISEGMDKKDDNNDDSSSSDDEKGEEENAAERKSPGEWSTHTKPNHSLNRVSDNEEEMWRQVMEEAKDNNAHDDSDDDIGVIVLEKKGTVRSGLERSDKKMSRPNPAHVTSFRIPNKAKQYLENRT